MPRDSGGDGFDVRSLSVTYRDGSIIRAHEHPWARLIHAPACLALGDNLTAAAFGCGYHNTSAFIAAFKRQFGVTPGRYVPFDAGEFWGHPRLTGVDT